MIILIIHHSFTTHSPLLHHSFTTLHHWCGFLQLSPGAIAGAGRADQSAPDDHGQAWRPLHCVLRMQLLMQRMGYGIAMCMNMCMISNIICIIRMYTMNSTMGIHYNLWYSVVEYNVILSNMMYLYIYIYVIHIIHAHDTLTVCQSGGWLKGWLVARFFSCD